MMGRWSEFRVVFGCQFSLVPRCEFVIVKSGEEVGPFRGILVGVSWLVIIVEVSSSALTISAHHSHITIFSTKLKLFANHLKTLNTTSLLK